MFQASATGDAPSPASIPPSSPGIRAAAGVIKSYVEQMADTYEPIGGKYVPECWGKFLQHCGLRVCGIVSEDFEAVTVHHARKGWVVVFDRTASPLRQCHCLAHELSEFLLATLDTEDIAHPDCTAHACQCDWRHSVSEEFVRMVFDD